MTIREFASRLGHGIEPGEYELTAYGKPALMVTVRRVGAASLNAPAPAAVEVKAEPVPAPVVELAPEVVPVPAAPALGNASRLAALLARGRSTLSKVAPADLPDDPAPAMPAMSQSRWRKLDPDARVRYVQRYLAATVTDEDALADWLESLPK
jgi:hypothetical protein